MEKISVSQHLIQTPLGNQIVCLSSWMYSEYKSASLCGSFCRQLRNIATLCAPCDDVMDPDTLALIRQASLCQQQRFSLNLSIGSISASASHLPRVLCYLTLPHSRSWILVKPAVWESISQQMKESSRPVRGNVDNVPDNVPSSYLRRVPNNRKSGEMSSPVITAGLFSPFLPIL